jgi:hypothetical protein
MKNKIGLLIHGPYSGSAYRKIFTNLKHQLPSGIYRKFQIVIVSYSEDYAKIVEEVNNCQIEELDYKIIQVKDLLNPGYFNINRQIVTVNAGLKAFDDKTFIIKLRNDQNINFRKLIKVLSSVNYFRDDSKEILTTNCYTRPDRKYHPSDMFLCGKKEELEKYYDMKIMDKTHMDVVLELIEHYNNTKEDMIKFFVCPENMLFINYLKHKGWKFKDTENYSKEEVKRDSFMAIRTYCHLVNTWDIDLRWEKKRTPLLPKGSVILPYSVVDAAPFPGLPSEKVECYSRSDFDGNLTNKDKWFLLLARLCFQFEYGNKRYSKENLKRRIQAMGSKISQTQKDRLKKTVIYKLYQYLCWSM